jgi:endonuclease-3
MTKKEKVAYILRELELLYPDPPVPLDHRDSFTLLIAVLLSAQCTDARVNLVTPKLFELADNPYEMVKLSVSLIESIIRPCGLSPAKSKNIHRLSELLIERHGGEVPSSLEEMEALPGVGHKTAGVVMIQAFGVPAFPVDTHIHRMLYRWGLSNGKSVQQTERDAKRLFPEETWIKLHLQIIFYAREYSPARGFSEDRDYVTMKVAGKVKSLPA